MCVFSSLTLRSVLMLAFGPILYGFLGNCKQDELMLHAYLLRMSEDYPEATGIRSDG